MAAVVDKDGIVHHVFSVAFGVDSTITQCTIKPWSQLDSHSSRYVREVPADAVVTCLECARSEM